MAERDVKTFRKIMLWYWAMHVVTIVAIVVLVVGLTCD